LCFHLIDAVKDRRIANSLPKPEGSSECNQSRTVGRLSAESGMTFANPSAVPVMTGESRTFSKGVINMRWLLGAIEAGLIVVQCMTAWSQEPPRPDAGAKAATAAEQTGRVTRARDLIGLEVLSQGGESYGMIDDLMIDKRTGQVEFILVETGKDSEELYPMPWKTVALYQGEDAQDQYVIVNMQKEQFSKAPTIVRQQWPAMTYTQWNTFVPQVTSYYGRIPRAEARAIRKTARAVKRAVD
jgi:sporulation protein YlmC with PRC-barrel domain